MSLSKHVKETHIFRQENGWYLRLEFKEYHSPRYYVFSKQKDLIAFLNKRLDDPKEEE